MHLLARLFKAITPGALKRRSWTPEEIRDLINNKAFSAAHQAINSLALTTLDDEAAQHCLRGETLFHQGLDNEAKAAFQAAVRIATGLPEAHYGLSLVLAEENDFETAVRHAQFAANAKLDGRYAAQVGYCHLRLDNFQAAESPLRLATTLSPKNAHVWNNLGIVLTRKGDILGARQSFLQALHLNPSMELARQHLTQLDCEEVLVPDAQTDSDQQPNDTSTAPENLLSGVTRLESEGDIAGAINICESLLPQHNDPSIPLKLSQLYAQEGDCDSSVDLLRAYLNRNPGCSVTSGALGRMYLQTKRFHLAEPMLKLAVAKQPDRLDYLFDLAETLKSLERHDEAARPLAQALALHPNDPQVLGQWASNLAARCQYEEALQTMDELRAKGHNPADYGRVLTYLGRIEEALAEVNARVARQPNEPSLRSDRAFLNLMLENYADGWDDYHFRNLSHSRLFRMLPFRQWRGEPLDGKKIILLGEQGLGDQVMFASCIPDLLACRPSEVIVEANLRISKTIERSFPSVKVVPSRQHSDMTWANDFSDVDYFASIADLAGSFRRSRSAFPEHSGYLVADRQRVAYWRAALQSCGPGPYLGVSWRGGVEQTRKVVRSFTPDTLLPLSGAIVATWVCLQYGEVQKEVEQMSASSMPLHYWASAISDLDEFAALISALDGVITVCNTTVHYAGALGKPVWILAPRVPEWRYGLYNTSLPWYPSSRVFRQAKDKDWTTPISDVCQAVIAFCSKNGSLLEIPDRAEKFAANMPDHRL